MIIEVVLRIAPIIDTFLRFKILKITEINRSKFITFYHDYWRVPKSFNLPSDSMNEEVDWGIPEGWVCTLDIMECQCMYLILAGLSYMNYIIDSLLLLLFTYTWHLRNHGSILIFEVCISFSLQTWNLFLCNE